MDMWYNGIAALLFYFVSEQSERVTSKSKLTF